MAFGKKKNDDTPPNPDAPPAGDEITRADDPAAGDAKAPEAGDELAKAQARIAALEAQLAAKGEAPPPPPPGTHPRWRVSLAAAPEVPAFVVEASDSANAFEEFKKAAFITHTPHVPTVVRTEEPVGRVGTGK